MARADRLSVFVAAHFIDEVRVALEQAFEVTFARSEDPLSELRGHDKRFDAVLVSLDLPMTAEAIVALPESVRALATYSVGTDHIDLDAAERRGLAVFNTPGVLADSVAENAIFLMLGAARRATESIELIRSGRWPGWNPTQLVGIQLKGRTLGILGMGDIGQRIGLRARALGMDILYCNRRRLAADHALAAGYRATPTALAAESDVLMLACPSTDETRGIVDDTLISAARPGMILVNIARGDIVNDEALIAGLGSGQVWAAGLDVFAGEPAVHPGYFELPNVFMLPHVGSSTIEARVGMGRILIDGLAAWQDGRVGPNRVR